MNYKRILTIQDISCVGQCSLTVAHPILSACGHEVCILPTAILSTHTGGFGRPVVHHLGADMHTMWRHWLDQGIIFDAILIGYLGSIDAIRCASDIIQNLLAPDGLAIVDPAMADHGKLYSGFDEAYAKAMKSLCEQADIVLPNITEAAMMSGVPYQENYDKAYIEQLLNKLPNRQIVLTGVGFEANETGAAIKNSCGISYYHHKKIGKNYHGTGDIFAACFTGATMQGLQIDEAVKLASDFTFRCISNTYAAPAHWYGVKFETALPWLIDELQKLC